MLVYEARVDRKGRVRDLDPSFVVNKLTGSSDKFLGVATSSRRKFEVLSGYSQSDLTVQIVPPDSKNEPRYMGNCLDDHMKWVSFSKVLKGAYSFRSLRVEDGANMIFASSDILRFAGNTVFEKPENIEEAVGQARRIMDNDKGVFLSSSSVVHARLRSNGDFEFKCACSHFPLKVEGINSDNLHHVVRLVPGGFDSFSRVLWPYLQVGFGGEGILDFKSFGEVDLNRDINWVRMANLPENDLQATCVALGVASPSAIRRSVLK